ncbi:MAG: 4-(cytidine 5'-diphospho)-2-C-methyl-D-erythritol kinase [Candidatus Omnitrophica bacterium]|nr:4-(cytidine 5'-diphospho)-2-C-methyl-D-erythritol kinase [Candidatus Omnitrophota bacterium]MBU1923709.1 4-(cytidine 5'-diphospho)-2-C-methyl-D-erythritol kinase [Candidatus Omnitrophota bacterium]
MKHCNIPLVIKSFAKLNLYLRVLDKRKDNFHNLDTLFVRIDLADTIILRGLKDNLIRIKCDNQHVPKNETNLCFRAAELLRQEFKLNLGLEIEIKKRIPVGAGLGGGSSNAASVLLGVNKYWHLNLSKAKLEILAAKLGSDVAFFIHDVKFALGSQRGDKIKPLDFLKNTKLWFILVYPGIKVPTPLIYQKFDLFLSARSAGLPSHGGISGLTRLPCDAKIFSHELLKNGCRVDAKCLFNDLEVIASSLYPVVNRVKDAFFAMGLERVMMSGSGPTVFAICNCQAQAQDLSNKLCREHKTWQVFLSSAI